MTLSSTCLLLTASAPSSVPQNPWIRLRPRTPRVNSAWISPKETKLLPAKAIDAYLSDSSKKNGKLKEAYTIAKDSSEWEVDQEKRRANGEFDHVDDDDEDVDMLDEDGEEKPAGSKKRKRSAAGDKKTKEPASKAKKESGAAAKKRKVRLLWVGYL